MESYSDILLYLYYCYSPPSFNLMCSVEEVCQLLDRQWRTFISYLTDNGGSFSVTCQTMEGCFQLLDRQWRKFVSYLSDNGGSLSVTCPTMEEVCQLLDRQWRKFVSYLSDNGGIFVFSFFSLFFCSLLHV